MASARKSVIVRKFSRDWCAGYAGAEFGQQKAELEFLDLTGKVVRIGWEQVKWVCYVRDFPAGSADQANPERLGTQAIFAAAAHCGALAAPDSWATATSWRDWRPTTVPWWKAPGSC